MTEIKNLPCCFINFESPHRMIYVQRYINKKLSQDLKKAKD